MTKTVNLAIIGSGVVGSSFIKQLIHLEAHVKFEVLYLARSSKEALYFEDYKPIDLKNYKTDRAKPIMSLGPLIEFLKKATKPVIFVDNTSNTTIAEAYPEIVKAGISIATPNKKAFSSSLSLWKDIFANSENDGGLVYHEATVGAGLPIISPLNDLVLTGDKVEKIEGIFSGTLSYIFNEFSSTVSNNVKFSDVVKIAKKLGYTEPDPRDDLNGLDVARKVTILARIVGFDIQSPDSFPIQSLIPNDLEEVNNVDEFLQRLTDYDSGIQRTKDVNFSERKVLRFVGELDISTKKAYVGIKEYPFDHPFASLKGSDNVISIKTSRYPNPLIIQGAGAGADVTAHGVLADVIKIAQIIGN